MTQEKSKPDIRKEFDENAIQWAARVGIEDVAIAKTVYWCVLNIYQLMTESKERYDEFEKALEDIKKIVGERNDTNKIESEK